MSEKNSNDLIVVGKSIALIVVIFGLVVGFDAILDGQGVPESKGQFISGALAVVLVSIAALLRKKIF